MIITYHGAHFFRVQFGDTVVAYNPVSKNSKFKQTRLGADIVLVSLRHEDMNGVELVARGDKVPFQILGPGEYEVKDIFIKGWPSVSVYGGNNKLINTIYSVVLENINLVFLGELSSEKDLPKEVIESIDSVDVLFVPVGGEGLLSPEDASKIALKLEPRLIIPMTVEENDSIVKHFLKEIGEEIKSKEEKLTLKKKDLEGKDGEVVWLKAA
jgi:L-ascorbate metabolism protein UlaG (beta-lactamase superfamily)